MKERRGYTQRARAEASAATRRRILDAAVELLETRLRSDIRLQDVARRAAVSVQTVLRVFGSREGLFDHAFARVVETIGTELDVAVPGDVPAAVAAWFDHYERVGDLVVRSLAEEADPAVGPIVRVGRREHRARVRSVFGLTDEHDRGLVDALVCACDVYAWKLLRRDLHRSRPEAEAVVRRTVESLLASA